MVKVAVQIVESLFASDGYSADQLADMAWNMIENVSDATHLELVTSRLILEVLGRTEGVPPPW